MLRGESPVDFQRKRGLFESVKTKAVLILAVFGHSRSMVSARVSDFARFKTLVQYGFCVGANSVWRKWPLGAKLQRLATLRLATLG